MNYAPISDYADNPVDFQNILSSICSPNVLISDKGEPVECIKTISNDSIKLKDLLIDILQGKEVIPINNEEYKNWAIDEMIKKIESFVPKFNILQDELDELYKEYDKQINTTQKNIKKINDAIQYMKKIEEEYNIDESIKEIVEKINNYSKKLYENDKLSEVKKKYIEKRKELNSYLYFIQKINKWNTSAICPICITNKIDSYCNPCGHTACKKCFERNSTTGDNINQSNKCPICREYIMEIRKLYFI